MVSNGNHQGQERPADEAKTIAMSNVLTHMALYLFHFTHPPPVSKTFKQVPCVETCCPSLRCDKLCCFHNLTAGGDVVVVKEEWLGWLWVKQGTRHQDNPDSVALKSLNNICQVLRVVVTNVQSCILGPQGNHSQLQMIGRVDELLHKERYLRE